MRNIHTETALNATSGLKEKKEFWRVSEYKAYSVLFSEEAVVGDGHRGLGGEVGENLKEL